jgi:hypothetical protein
MQTSTNTEHRLSSRHFVTTARLAIPQGAFETRHQPGREVSVVDGLIAVTQHAWGFRVEIDERDEAAVAGQ